MRRRLIPVALAALLSSAAVLAGSALGPAAAQTAPGRSDELVMPPLPNNLQPLPSSPSAPATDEAPAPVTEPAADGAPAAGTAPTAAAPDTVPTADGAPASGTTEAPGTGTAAAPAQPGTATPDQQPATAAGQPSATPGQPATAAGQPATAAGQPAAGQPAEAVATEAEQEDIREADVQADAPAQPDPTGTRAPRPETSDQTVGLYAELANVRRAPPSIEGQPIARPNPLASEPQKEMAPDPRGQIENLFPENYIE